MSNTVSDYVQGYKGDFDNDGADEYIFTANYAVYSVNRQGKYEEVLLSAFGT